MKKINVGVIGTGYWGKKHVYEYNWLEDVNVIGVSDLSTENLRFCKEEHDVPFATKDYHELLADPRIDAVSICTPNETHYHICKDAFEAGKHALVEKPVTLASKAAQELVALARAENLVFAVGHIYRFNDALTKMRELIRKGFFEQIFEIKLQWTTLSAPIKDRDIIFDLAPHSFDILNYLLDMWPIRICCHAKAYRRKKLEEHAYIITEFENDVTGHIELSWLVPGKVREVFVIGRGRCARINALSQQVTVYESGYEYDMNIPRNNTIKTELTHFVDCIRTGQTSTNSGEIGAKTVEMIEKTKLALSKGVTVKT